MERRAGRRDTRPVSAADDDPQLEIAVSAIERATRTGAPMPSLVSERPELTLHEAYMIQRAWVARRTAAGARPVGWKVGLTSAASQGFMGASMPMFGALLDHMQIATGGTCDTAALVAPRLEAEIAFRLSGALPEGDFDVADVLAVTGAVAPALEIVDTRIAPGGRDVRDAVADQGRACAFVLGDWVAPRTVGDLAAVTATLSTADETIGTGAGAVVLGHPARSIAWLAPRLARAGVPLGPGSIVLAGALVGPAPAPPGSSFRADFGTALGNVAVRFT